jgi:hypothetical protein
MSAYSDEDDEGYNYDSDAALDLDDDADDDANALLEDEVGSEMHICHMSLSTHNWAGR